MKPFNTSVFSTCNFFLDLIFDHFFYLYFVAYEKPINTSAFLAASSIWLGKFSFCTSLKG